MIPIPINVAFLISPRFLYPISQPSVQPTSQPSTHPTRRPRQQVFTCTHTYVNYTVPLGYSFLLVQLYGAMGTPYDGNLGGYGGYIQAIIAVTPGATLQVWVGGAANGGTAGFNGGGSGAPYSGRGGGGATDIRTTSSLSSRIIVVGGGGGAAYGGSGGAGGGLIGGSGKDHGGHGGSQTYGGGRADLYISSSAPNNASFGVGSTSGNCGP